MDTVKYLLGDPAMTITWNEFEGISSECVDKMQFYVSYCACDKKELANILSFDYATRTMTIA